MIVTSVQIKTAKTQKHLYCPVFTSKGYKKDIATENSDFIRVFSVFIDKISFIGLNAQKRYFSQTELELSQKTVCFITVFSIGIEINAEI